MLRRSLVASCVLLATAVSCSRSSLDVGSPPAHPSCESASGVRICGEGCPPVDECSGPGCTPLESWTGGSSAAGVCWADSEEMVYRCDACGDGAGCIDHDGVLVCVAVDVCETLWELGVRDVCRYTDKEPYDHRALPSASGCPAPHGEAAACGGDCPPCAGGARCSGVAPDHPFGLCNGWQGGYRPNVGCGADVFSNFCLGADGQACAVFDTPNDFAVAYKYGVCLPIASCLAMANGFPGGLGCYDATQGPIH